MATTNGKLPPEWDAASEALLRDWRNRALAASTAHYKLATRLKNRNLGLGIPVVILSSIVGSSLFATIDDKTKVPVGVRFAIAVVSMIAAVLSALQTFLRFGARAEKHVFAADWYAAVRREIDQYIVLSPADRGRPKELLDRLRKEMGKVGQQAPEIPEPLWVKLRGEFGVDEPFTYDAAGAVASPSPTDPGVSAGT
ncbi:MAG: hypothetical protein V7605_2565 [Acidimicrobiaceae bacterium]|jgi:hypothetical protein